MTGDVLIEETAILKRLHALGFWSFSLFCLILIIDVSCWLIFFIQRETSFISPILAITFSVMSIYLLLVSIGCMDTVIKKAMEIMAFDLDAHLIYLRDTIRAEDNRGTIEHSDAIEKILHLAIDSDAFRSVKQSRFRFLLFHFLKFQITGSFLRKYHHLIKMDAKKFQDRIKAISLEVDGKIAEGDLVAGSFGVSTMKDLTKVFELNKRIPHQRLLDAAIAEKISKIESRRMVIKRNLETDLNDVQLSIQAIGSLQSVRRIVQIEHMARRAGLIDLVIIAQDVFTSLQQQGKDDLKKHFGMTKKKVMARGDRKNFIMIYNEFVKIKELAEAFEIADIVNEAQYWLENFSSLERLMGVFNEGNDSCTLQYLQAKMDMDKPTFSSFIIDWAGPLGLKIEDNFVRFEKEDLSSAIEKIDEMFAAWKENEISKEKIGRKDTKL